MNSIRRTATRSAAVSLSRRDPSSLHTSNIYNSENELYTNIGTDTNNQTFQHNIYSSPPSPLWPSPSPPSPSPYLYEQTSVSVRDVGAIQSQIDNVFTALQSSGPMTDTEISLLNTVRDTAADSEIVSKIMNNPSFLDFMSRLAPQVGFEHRSQIAAAPYGNLSSLPSHTQITTADGSDVESLEDSDVGHPYTTSTTYTQGTRSITDDSDTDEESNFLRGRARRMYTSGSDTEDERLTNNNAQQRALNRLNELCHQISPDLGLGSSRRGSVSTSSNPESRTIYAENNSTTPTPEPAVSRPTMEGAGIPGGQVPLDNPTANSMYLFIITACVIPITVLAVAAVVYPSNRTWSLLRSGFKAVCGQIFA